MLMEAELYKVCAKMLEMDERNFHCWNYRSWVVESYLEEMKVRAELFESENLYDFEKALVEKEVAIAFKMIEKNFSNYSAWHYRSKLLPLLHHKFGRETNHLDYVIPLESIKEDLGRLKHAFFTDPKD